MATLSDTQINAVLDTAVEGIITIDDSGIVQTFNKAAEKLFGYKADEVVGQSVRMLMPSPYCDHHDEYIANYRKTGKNRIIGIGREIVGKRKDDSVFPLYLSVAESTVGNVRTYTGIIRDLSESKRMELMLRQKEEELARYDRRHTLGEMASAIAHEINQPLAAITTYAQACSRLLDSASTDILDIKKALGEIGKQAERAGSVMKSLRNMTRGQPVDREIVDINFVISDILPVIRAGAAPRHITINPQLAPEEIPVEVNRIQIQQVILNLANNALEESPPQSSISIISSMVANHYVEISVADAGKGVDETISDQIFHPYFTTKPKGTGMGLTISESIVTTHQGRIGHRANSRGGATFFFTLPIYNND